MPRYLWPPDQSCLEALRDELQFRNLSQLSYRPTKRTQNVVYWPGLTPAAGQSEIRDRLLGLTLVAACIFRVSINAAANNCNLVVPRGLEPLTFGFRNRCSTT